MIKFTLARIIKRYFELASVKQIQDKGLRHSSASYLINEFNVSVLILSKRLVHSGPEITLKHYLKGVTIGDNVIVRANCLIYKDIPANSIITNHTDLMIQERPQASYNVFTLTASDSLENLEYLVKSLPQIDFHIAAPVFMSENLERFDRYQNVVLYTNVFDDDVILDILDRADIYLDINHGTELNNIVKTALDKNKPVLTFDNIGRLSPGVLSFSESDPSSMVTHIKMIIGQL